MKHMEIFGCTHAPAKDQVIIQLMAVTPSSLQAISKQSPFKAAWLGQQSFHAISGEVCIIPSSEGSIDQVLFGWHKSSSMGDFAKVVQALPVGHYRLILDHDCSDQLADFAKIWGLCCYEFTRYRLARKSLPTLVIDDLSKQHRFALNRILNATYQVRNWINTPAEDFGPEELSDLCHALGNRYKAHVHEVVGDDLLKENYPLIHMVGRASTRQPRMICLRWGKESDPAVALVGKGVCFDTGGIQVKPHAAMQTMKKDMGGAAHMIALAEMIMASKLSIRLSLWIGAVDNSVSGRSYLPGDVATARNGMTIEVGHTDAEGRLVLADMLSAAAEDKPSCIVDYATLTGAQRVALGMEIPAVFASNQHMLEQLLRLGQQHNDPIWPLPLYQPYISQLDSDIADISSTGKTPYGGAILAALFLQHFVPEQTDWLHIDASCFNTHARPGYPRGGEAMALEALFALLQTRVQRQDAS
jgi:leucyl aminopeptidase